MLREKMFVVNWGWSKTGKGNQSFGLLQSQKPGVCLMGVKEQKESFRFTVSLTYFPGRGFLWVVRGCLLELGARTKQSLGGVRRVFHRRSY